MFIKLDNDKIIDYHIENSIAFVCDMTKNTVVLKSVLGHFICSQGHLTPKELGFIKKVKTYANKQPESSIKYNSTDVNYFKFCLPVETQKIYNVCEIDINMAYWQIAYNLGYISEKIFNESIEREKEILNSDLSNEEKTKAIKTNKHLRLISLGSLATVKHKYIFDGVNEPQLVEKIVNEKTRNFWFIISHHLGLIMQTVFDACKTKPLLYWVDAFFVDISEKIFIQQFIKEKFSLDVKIKELSYIRTEKTPETFTIFAKEPDKPNEKIFHFRDYENFNLYRRKKK